MAHFTAIYKDPGPRRKQITFTDRSHSKEKRGGRIQVPEWIKETSTTWSHNRHKLW